MEWEDTKLVSRDYIKQPPEVLDYYLHEVKDKVDTDLDWVVEHGGKDDLYGSMTGPATAYSILNQVDQQDAEDFMCKLMTGEYLNKESVIMKARTKIRNDKDYATRNRFQYPIQHYCATVFAAWNHYRQGNDPQKFHVSKDTFPIPK